jgi:hypothetical protein
MAENIIKTEFTGDISNEDAALQKLIRRLQDVESELDKIEEKKVDVKVSVSVAEASEIQSHVESSVLNYLRQAQQMKQVGETHAEMNKTAAKQAENPVGELTKELGLNVNTEWVKSLSSPMKEIVSDFARVTLGAIKVVGAWKKMKEAYDSFKDMKTVGKALLDMAKGLGTDAAAAKAVATDVALIGTASEGAAAASTGAFATIGAGLAALAANPLTWAIVAGGGFIAWAGKNMYDIREQNAYADKVASQNNQKVAHMSTQGLKDKILAEMDTIAEAMAAIEGLTGSRYEAMKKSARYRQLARDYDAQRKNLLALSRTDHSKSDTYQAEAHHREQMAEAARLNAASKRQQSVLSDSETKKIMRGETGGTAKPSWLESNPAYLHSQFAVDKWETMADMAHENSKLRGGKMSQEEKKDLGLESKKITEEIGLLQKHLKGMKSDTKEWLDVQKTILEAEKKRNDINDRLSKAKQDETITTILSSGDFAESRLLSMGLAPRNLLHLSKGHDKYTDPGAQLAAAKAGAIKAAAKRPVQVVVNLGGKEIAKMAEALADPLMAILTQEIIHTSRSGVGSF